jgi:hypothetical protein
MAQEELDALASVVQSLKSDLIRLQGAFARDALLSGRHGPRALATLSRNAAGSCRAMKAPVRKDLPRQSESAAQMGRLSR